MAAFNASYRQSNENLSPTAQNIFWTFSPPLPPKTARSNAETLAPTPCWLGERPRSPAASGCRVVVAWWWCRRRCCCCWERWGVLSRNQRNCGCFYCPLFPATATETVPAGWPKGGFSWWLRTTNNGQRRRRVNKNSLVNNTGQQHSSLVNNTGQQHSSLPMFDRQMSTTPLPTDTSLTFLPRRSTVRPIAAACHVTAAAAAAVVAVFEKKKNHTS